ncbi:MAG: hypothetical protein A3J66_02180 [Candidatus Magasanikbacteria bacterium RIFCSPHIGHO2_02_FULL_47_14]|uniref:Uncharacterized protein n=1 Tax=Candidatus Magasanikbacteria bacterium RIFCSPHIGHO2_02_FULL_47_14 TaxID=1798680 RepID=A0A1F6M1D8_9BACT|nr:MAG: hypothetical protein A3J66_02180 [Candidatus Magasanikbacteria bacterium RIFCSPHIGHO2_02_FULL_47_14]
MPAGERGWAGSYRRTCRSGRGGGGEIRVGQDPGRRQAVLHGLGVDGIGALVDQVGHAVALGDAVEVAGAGGLLGRHHRGVVGLGHVEHATLRVIGVHVRRAVVRRADAHGGRVGVRRDDQVVVRVDPLHLQDGPVTVLEDPGDGAVLADRDRDRHPVELRLLRGQVVGVDRGRDVARAGGLVVGADDHDLRVVAPDIDVQAGDGLHLERFVQGLEAGRLAPERVGELDRSVAGGVAVDRLAGLLHGRHDGLAELLQESLGDVGLAVEDVAEHHGRWLALAAAGHTGDEVDEHERVVPADGADGLGGERRRPVADGPVRVVAGTVGADAELDPAGTLGAGEDIGGRQSRQIRRDRRHEIALCALHDAPSPSEGEDLGSMPTFPSTIGYDEKKEARRLAARKYTYRTL